MGPLRPTHVENPSRGPVGKTHPPSTFKPTTPSRPLRRQLRALQNRLQGSKKDRSQGEATSHHGEIHLVEGTNRTASLVQSLVGVSRVGRCKSGFSRLGFEGISSF